MGCYTYCFPPEINQFLFLFKYLRAVSVKFPCMRGMARNSALIFSMPRLLFIALNIAVRLITIAIGILIVNNWLNLPPEQDNAVRWIGWIMIFVGLLRSIMYALALRREFLSLKKENNDAVDG